MSRIPLKAPSRTRDQSLSRRETSDKENTRLHVKRENIEPKIVHNRSPFKTPSKPIRAPVSTNGRTEIAREATLREAHPSLRGNAVSAVTGGLSSGNPVHKRPTSAVDSQKTPGRPLHKSKSTIGIKEHIARARAELQKSGKKTPAKAPLETFAPAWTAERIRNQPSLLDDPFSAIKDPFNQARNRPRSDPGIDEAVIRARADGRLNIAGMQLALIPKAVLDMYKPDPSHVIDFSQDMTTSWYEYVDLTILNAADNDLHIIDEDFFDIAGGLCSIDLHNNKLTQLPAGMLNLSQLLSVNLSNNNLDISALSSLCQISSLTELRMSHNRLCGQLPLDLSNLTSLQILDLSQNEITSVNDSLLGCSQLQSLNLSNNKISEFKVSQMSTMKGLYELDISRNAIQAPLIDCNAKFTRLTTLNLSHNKLTALAIEDVSLSLPQLNTLLVLQNQLTELKGMRDLEHLLILNIEGNQFTRLTDDLLSALQECKQLDISDNQFLDIPWQIARLPALTHFQWEGNPARMRGCFGMNTVQMLQFLQSRAPLEE